MNPPTNPISLLLLTHNNSKEIKKNIGWVGECPSIKEIIVVDDDSTDDSSELVKRLVGKSIAVKTYRRHLNQDFSSQRNFGLEKCSNDWILWLDPDEAPSLPLIHFLDTTKLSDNHTYSFKRTDTFLNHTLNHGETASQYLVRLFPKNSGKFVGMVHEVWSSASPKIKTNLTIYHSSHPSLKTFIDKINFYSTIRAKELFQAKHPLSLFEIVFYPIFKFLQNYLLRLGFLDSTPGIIIALGMSFHSFLVRAKLWHLYQK